MKGKDIVSIADLTREEIIRIFVETKRLKDGPRYITAQQGKTLGMIFHKPSTRTRVSFEVAMVQLGGYALYLGAQDLQLRRGETIGDTGKTLSRYLNAIMIRTYSHQDVIDLAEASSIPVINGLTDLLHPCQVLADLYTIIEARKKEIATFDFSKLRIAFVGDGNNVCNSFINAQKKLGFNLSIATPEQYKPSLLGNVKGISWTSRPAEAVRESAVIYTDVWASMGKEQEQEERKKVFRPFQVNRELLEKAAGDPFIMHCLPAHRGEEITDEVIDGKNSIVFTQAENRLHVQKAALNLVLG
ncbi:MAG TPA: ornithine carbamoyltransferase [bacterium]|nr:ornithine carbamoyltransferase [bacterium]